MGTHVHLRRGALTTWRSYARRAGQLLWLLGGLSACLPVVDPPDDEAPSVPDVPDPPEVRIASATASLPATVVPFGDDLVCTVTVEGVDSEVDVAKHADQLSYAFTWRHDGEEHTEVATTTHAGDTIAASVLDHGIWACDVEVSANGTSATSIAQARAALDRNVMVLVADDLGVNHVGAYGHWDGPSITPNLDQLASEGILFRHGYVNNRCTATRSTALTGRQVGRHGLARLDSGNPDSFLPFEEVLIPEMLHLSPWPYTSGAIGKWHLAHIDYGLPDDPRTHGFDTHRGTWGNLNAWSYFDWPKLIDGVETFTQVYASTDQVDDALLLSETLPQPWFLWVAFNAPHRPFHVPPDHLHDQDVDENSSKAELYRAMVQALDTEIGRLLDEMDPVVRSETTILFVGDNGIMHDALDYAVVPARQAKATMYEQGIHVPWIVASPHVTQPGTTSDSLVHIVDLFPTMAELADVDPAQLPDIDGVSFLPILADPTATTRTFVWSEDHQPVGPPPWSRHDFAIRDDRYKLTWRPTTGREEFFDLEPRAFDDGPDLLKGELTVDEKAAFEALRAELDVVFDTVVYEY